MGEVREGGGVESFLQDSSSELLSRRFSADRHI